MEDAVAADAQVTGDAWEAATSAELTRQLDNAVDGDPGIQRAGQYVAARRADLGLSQRDVGELKVLSPAALVAFEKGRSWPRDDTLARLETLLNCPPGTLAQIRYGTPAPPPLRRPSNQQNADTGAALPLRIVHSALRLLTAWGESLPSPTAPEFTDQAAALLAELREIRAVATELARISRQPEAITALGQLHRLYTDTMQRAATSPQASLGQQLYAARRVLNLSVDDIAAISAVPAAAIVAAENEQPVETAQAEALNQFLSATARG